MNWVLLQNSLFVATLATLLAVGFGFTAALWASCLAGRGRDALRLGGLLALMMPPFLTVNCWLDLFGFTGSWKAWLPFDIYTLKGTVWVLALLLWPVTFLAVSSAWNRLQPAQLESDSALTGWRLLNELLVPVASSALVQATALTFVLALNQFAVPAILQTKVYPAEIWVRFNTLFDYAGATRMSWPLILAPLGVLFWLRGREIYWPSLEPAATATLVRRQLGGRWFGGLAVASAGLLVLSVGLPLFELAVASRTWVELPSALAAGRAALGNTLFYAVVTATLCVALPLAGWRWRGAGLLWLGFLVPGVLAGIVLIFVMNRPLFGHFYQSAGIVILAFTLRYLAVGWNLVARARRTVDRDLMDDARLNGAGRWQLLRHVNWPQIAPQVAAAWYLVYLLCLWDVEGIVLIVPPGGETLALRVFNLLHYGHNAQVNALCLTLLALAVLPLCLWRVGSWLAVAGRKQSGAIAGLLSVAGLGLLTGCAPEPDGAPVESKIFSRVKVIGTRGTGLGQFNKPRSVAVDAQDNLYVVDMTGRVQKFSPDGAFLSFWEMPQTDKGKPKGMCRDEAGNILVVEPHYSRVNHFNGDGKLVGQWGIDGTNAGQLAFPRAVMVNRQGEAYVSEYGRTERVQRFAERGAKFVNGFGKPGNGPGEFNRAEGLGLDAQGRVFVADSCNHRVQVFTPDGKFLRAFGRAGSGPGEMSYPYDVRVDSLGREYVCEFGNSRVQIFDPNGQPLEILGGAGGAPGQMNNPWAITLDSQGNLYVADSLNHRVLKFFARRPGEAHEARAPGRSGKRQNTLMAADLKPFSRPSFVFGQSINETLSPSLSLLKEGRGGKLRMPRGGSQMAGFWHERVLLPLFACGGERVGERSFLIAGPRCGFALVAWNCSQCFTAFSPEERGDCAGVELFCSGSIVGSFESPCVREVRASSRRLLQEFVESFAVPLSVLVCPMQSGDRLSKRLNYGRLA